MKKPSKIKKMLRTFTKVPAAITDDYYDRGPLGREVAAVTFNNSQHFLDVIGLDWKMFVKHNIVEKAYSITIEVSDPERPGDTYLQFKNFKDITYLPVELVRLWRRELTIKAMRMVHPNAILLSINPEEHSVVVGVPSER